MGDQNNQWRNSEEYSLSKKHYKKRCYTILCIASVGLPVAERKMQARQNLLTFRTRMGILRYWSAFYVRTSKGSYNK